MSQKCFPNVFFKYCTKLSEDVKVLMNLSLFLSLVLLVCIADDGNMVFAEHCLQMLLPDKAWNQSGTYSIDLYTFFCF